MILTVDVGNTAVTFGLFKGYRIIYRENFSTALIAKNCAELKKLLARIEKYALNNGSTVKGVCVSGVVPSVTKIIIDTAKKALKTKILNVDHRTFAGIKIKIRKPEELGADRIVDGACAYHFFGGPCIIVDMGTATTFECVDKKGNYLGGLIMPGVGMSARALHAFTAKLPEVKFDIPKRSIGKDTRECILAGLYYGNIGMVERTLEACEKVLGSKSKVILTGGYSRYFFNKIRHINYYRPDLTLSGLRLIWEMNEGY